MNDFASRTTIVVGASRGLGRGIATALAEAGAPVVAVARSGPALVTLAETIPSIRTEVADATDPTVAGVLIERHEPSTVILVAGASPVIRPLQEQTWETFSVNWHTDVRLTFHWLRECLVRPLRETSRVIVISSGAAQAGSPLSGGYAGAKATQRFMAAYAQAEADRAGLGITFTTVLPRITPFTALGQPAIAAYAARNGQTEQEYLLAMGAPLTPALAGDAMVELLRTETAPVIPAYLLTGAGLQPLP